MLSAGTIAVTMLVSAYGDEPRTREEKFRGALVELAPEVRGTPTENPPRSELAALLAKRPDLEPAATVLGLSIGTTFIGALIFSISWAAGEIGVFFFAIGLAVTGASVISGIVSGVVMSVLGAEQTRIDARIRELRNATPTPPQVVLARF